MSAENGNPQEEPALSPQYVPALEDSALLIRFVGNTAVIAGAQFKAVDAFQLLAVGEYLTMKGRQTIAANEAAVAEQLARSRIMVPRGTPAIDPSTLREGPLPG